MTAQARLLGGRYQVGELLGYGGMAEVHQGRDLRLGRDVAIKMLRTDLARDNTFQMRFRREAQNSASLNHPAIVSVYDTGEERSATGETLPFIVMEFVNGRTLKEVLAVEGRLQPRRALEITADICAALEFSHRHGIIHRDIKPGNVMMTQNGQVKVMDFGIARALASGATTMTQTSAVIGTAQYLSPEQARGESVDARSDVYAAGCVLFELLCGHPPFVGDNPVSVAYQHVREDPRPPGTINRDVTPDIDAVVLKALAKNPLNRYQSAAEMRSDVLRAAAGRPVHATPVMSEEETYAMAAAAQPTRQMNRAARGPARPARTSEPPPRRSSAWTMAVLSALGVLAVVALVAGLIMANRDKGDEVTDVALPDVTNLQEGVARDQLTKAGFQVTLGDPISNDTCEEDTVAAQNPAGGVGQTAPEGSTVTIQMCAGKPEVEVPNVLNLTEDQAREKIEGKGLKFESEKVDSAKEAGTVVEVNPEVGTMVAADSTVKVKISRGNVHNVPNVVGKDVETAQGILDGNGFKVNVREGATVPAGDSRANTVQRQDPQGDSTTTKDTVTIYVYVAEEAPPTDNTDSPSPEPTDGPTTGGPPGT